MRRRQRRDREEAVGFSCSEVAISCSSTERALAVGWLAPLLPISLVGVESSANACNLMDRRFFLEPEVPAFTMRSDREWSESFD